MKKRWLAVAATTALAAGMLASPGVAATPPAPVPDSALIATEGTQASTISPGKIDVMAIWAHPDDDAGLGAPCGVLTDYFGTRCGIMLVTRGEGGSNSVGSESASDLGLRRENEDRNAHVRQGLHDIFFLDRVDFYYNTSAPLTELAWDQEEVLRRAVRVVRETQPEVLVSWTAALSSGHGNHQDAGRIVWEVAAAASDPAMFPEQLTGPDAVSTWQVKRILESTGTAGEGASESPQCMSTFQPDAADPYPVVGVWTGYDAHDPNTDEESPYTWRSGTSDVSGVADGTVKNWGQVGAEDGRAHATQARTMLTTTWTPSAWRPSCYRWSMPWSLVPIHPMTDPDSRRDDTVLLGATIADTGGLPLGSLFYGTADAYRVGQGESTVLTVHMSSGEGTLGAGTVSLTAPAGWTVSASQHVDSITEEGSQLSFTVTTATDAPQEVSAVGISFTSDDGATTAYNQAYVMPVPAVAGAFERWGNFAEYETWMQETDAYSGGLSEATERIGVGESITLPVVITNRSSESVSGTASLSVPDGSDLELAESSLPFADLAPGQSTTVDFTVTHTNLDAAGGVITRIGLTTDAGGTTSAETLTMYVVPSTVIPGLDAAPTLDGSTDGDDYSTALDLSRVWEGTECGSAADCGAGSQARVGWYGDALYYWVSVTDDAASAAVTPDRCFGHWLVDSVELLIDPTGRSDDTSSTFKLGIYPFTDDAHNSNGNGVNGPCWARDADNHQGFATGPLSIGNAEGVQVVADAVRTEDGGYEGGAWLVEVKIPFAALPARIAGTSPAPTGALATNTVDPDYVGINVTPYDSDNADFIGDTRLAWSPFGSQQSEPYRWGHAYLDGYTSVGGAYTGIIGDVDAPVIPQTALQGTESPQTIYQSAARGVTIAGHQPTTGVTVESDDVTITPEAVTIRVSGSPGRVNAYLWQGDPRFAPVWSSSCVYADGEIDYGFDACSESDGRARPWDAMSGHLLAAGTGTVSDGTVTIPITQEIYDALLAETRSPAAASNGFVPRILVSFRSETEPYGGGGAVDAWQLPLALVSTQPTPTTPSEPTTGPSAVPSVAPTAQAGSGPRSSLARTGAAAPALVPAVVLLLGGGALLFSVRRRHVR